MRSIKIVEKNKESRIEIELSVLKQLLCHFVELFVFHGCISY